MTPRLEIIGLRGLFGEPPVGQSTSILTILLLDGCFCETSKEMYKTRRIHQNRLP